MSSMQVLAVLVVPALLALWGSAFGATVDSLAVVAKWSWPPSHELATAHLVAYRDSLFAGGHQRADHGSLRVVGGWDASGTWHDGAEPRPLPVDAVISIEGLGVVEDRLYVLGAVADGDCGGRPELFVYDGVWQRPPSLPIDQLFQPTGIDVYQGKLLAFSRGGAGAARVFEYDGGDWIELPPPPSDAHMVTRMEVLQDGALYAVAGRQEQYLDVDYLRKTRRHFALYRYGAGGWSELRKGTGGLIQSVVVHEGDPFISFAHINEPDSVYSVERWDGTQWHRVGPQLTRQGASGQGGVSLGVHRDVLVAAGFFDRIGDYVCNGLAVFDGRTWRPFPSAIRSSVGPRLWSFRDCLFVTGSLWKPDQGQSVYLARYEGTPPLPMPLHEPPPPMPVVSRPRPLLPEFANGRFDVWEDGLPMSWSRFSPPGVQLVPGSIDSSLASFVQPLEGGGIRLTEPHVQTRGRTWIRQSFRVPEGTHLRARIVARLVQPHLSLLSFPARFSLGAGEDYNFLVIDSADFETYELTLPTGTSHRGSVTLWLSDPRCTLDVKEVVIDVVRSGPEAVFEEVSRAFRERYVNWDSAPVDVDSLLLHYRPIASHAVNAEAFTNILLGMLRSLDDSRIALWDGESDYASCNLTAAADPPDRRLIDPGRRPDTLTDRGRAEGAYYGDIEPGVFYIRIWDRVPAIYGGADSTLVQRLASARAIVLDLRDGGNRENCSAPSSAMRRAEAFASLFAETVIPYGVERRRGEVPRSLALTPGVPHLSRIPMVVLVNHATRNSATLLALMLKALPGVELVGQTTSGGADQNEYVALSNGQQLYLPQAQYLDVEGRRVTDRRGVQPDVEVGFEPGRDATYETAMEYLRQKLGSRVD